MSWLLVFKQFCYHYQRLTNQCFRNESMCGYKVRDEPPFWEKYFFQVGTYLHQSQDISLRHDIYTHTVYDYYHSFLRINLIMIRGS